RHPNSRALSGAAALPTRLRELGAGAGEFPRGREGSITGAESAHASLSQRSSTGERRRSAVCSRDRRLGGSAERLVIGGSRFLTARRARICGQGPASGG